jgi:hypothetical protein
MEFVCRAAKLALSNGNIKLMLDILPAPPTRNKKEPWLGQG